MPAYSMDLRARVVCRVDGLTAPGLLEGQMDGDGFLAYLDQVLVPTLQSGDFVVWKSR